VRWRHGDTLPAPEAATDLPRSPSADLRSRLEKLPAGHPSAPDYPQNSWERAKAGFAEAWQRHQDRWPHPESKPEQPLLSTHGDQQLQRVCEKIQGAEQEITSSLQSIEALHPGRSLAGLEHRLKSQDRLIEKAKQDVLDKPGRSAEMALTLMPDAVRYTICYEAEDYAVGLQEDIDYLKATGYEMIKLKNYWSDPEYRGVNSQWRDDRTGQRFEVQFHTAISFEAKQLTHDAYDRLRDPQDKSPRELSALHKLQQDLAMMIPKPPGADDIRSRV
jgi:hypothetical protein